MRATEELLVIVVGLVLLCVGLAFWAGWPVAMTAAGALLVAGGVSSAVGKRTA